VKLYSKVFLKLFVSFIKITIIMISVSSCKSNFSKAEDFYKTWESHSTPISQQSYNKLDPVYQTAYRIYEKFIEASRSGKNRLNPNIKYLVIQETINLSICDSIIETKDSFDRLFFEPIHKQESTPYIMHPDSNTPGITLLYYTDVYKELIKKRNRFSTASVYGLKKDKNIMAVFDGQLSYPRNKMIYDDLLFNIDEIIVSKDLKGVIIRMSHNFGTEQFYYKYDLKNNVWNVQPFDKWSEN